MVFDSDIEPLSSSVGSKHCCKTKDNYLLYFYLHFISFINEQK